MKPKNLEIVPCNDNSIHMTPVKNPRKTPKMPQWQWWFKEITPLSMVVYY